VSAPAIDVEEVRVAMALNGGVSLAVWMGGCGVELDAARRAHVTPERPLYSALCRAFQRELVVDLMSGASAGGINGALLGAAICHGSCLAPGFVRKKWLELGDFGALLHPTSNISPRSLMQGELFTKRLKDTFDGLTSTDSTVRDRETISVKPLAPGDVKLTVTTTNLVGEPVTFADTWGETLQARNFRARFRFREAADFTPQRLAEAARASASFPVAFEPFQVSAADVRNLAEFPVARWVVDGGLLDNAPIAAVLELIPTRAASRQVRRYVLYVNADATIPPEPKPDPEGPTLLGIVNSVVNLPRQAPFVDQLHAIKRATQPAASWSEEPGLALLLVGETSIRSVAEELLPAYRRERVLQSLEEITGDPAVAREAFKDYGDGVDLPWIPQSLEPAGSDDRWQWGIHAAVRALHLLNDALRPAIRTARRAERERLLAARGAIFDQIAPLERLRSEPTSHGDHARAPIERAMSMVAAIDPREPIARAVEAVLTVEALLDPRLVAGLFGSGERPAEAFMRRALAVEVVRRALHAEEPFDTAQRLAFAQLTPFSPGWLFTDKPWGSSGPSTPEAKLLGLGLQHFAGFYRRSWRANDFMWGRLDAAGRIVDMLVSDLRARQLEDDGRAEKPWDVLAAALLPANDPLSLQLVVEALAGVPDGYPDGDDVETRLAAAIEHDLLVADERCELTRILCTRAAQLEVFREEWRVLESESARDAGLGGGTRALDLGDDDAAALENLRMGGPLPKRLAAPDEVASRLALQTATHAGLVALGAVRAAGKVGQPLFALRAALLPIAGAVAKSWLYRAAVVLAFWSAAVFLAGRTLQTGGRTSLDGAWTASLLVTLFAVLAVIGVVVVPALRAALGRRMEDALWAVALALAGLGSIGGALISGVSVTDVVAAPRAEEVAGWALGLVIAVVLGTPIVGIPALVSSAVGRVLIMPWGGLLALPLAALASTIVGVASVGWVFDAVGEGWWQTAGAVLALASGPLLALRLLVLPQH
jgi:predicted acylesterase/phospholipase RssA